MGESFLKSKSANYLFNSLKEFLFKNNKLTNEWNSLNILSTDAATVGSFDLDIIGWKMPYSDGHQVLTNLRERGSSIRVVVYSAADVFRRAHVLGGAGFY